MAVEGSVEEGLLNAWTAAMQTNYFGALQCIQDDIRFILPQRRGCIIDVSSVAGRIACAPLTLYAAAKRAESLK